MNLNIISLFFEQNPNGRLCIPYSEDAYNKLITKFIVVLEQTIWNDVEMVVLPHVISTK